MTELDAEARALLDAVREHDTPSGERVASIGATLQARHRAGDPGPSLPRGDAAISAGRGAWWLVAGSFAVAAVVAAALMTTRDPAPEPSRVAAPGQLPAVDGPAPIDAGTDAFAPLPAAPPAPRQAPAPRPVAERSKGTVAGDVDAPAAQVADPAAEIRLMRRAASALAKGEAGRALRLLADHERRFTSGLLVEERWVLRAEAHCALGKASKARREASSFLAAYPSSVFAARARRVCSATETPTD